MMRVVLAVCVVSVTCLGMMAAGQGMDELLMGAEAAFDRWSGPFDFAAYQQDLETAISLWERALPLIPPDDPATQARVLNRLAQAHFELAEAYLFAPAEREAAYGAGRDYALRSLRLDPAFSATEAVDGFRAALSSANDVAAVFWYGNNVGQWYNFNQLSAIMGGVRDVLACYERAVELDETYMGGGPHRSLAALTAQAYFVLGRSLDDAVPHYERALELDPDYLEGYYNYARFYAMPTGRDELASSLLRTLDEKAADPIVMAKWPLYNALAVQRAKPLPR